MDDSILRLNIAVIFGAIADDTRLSRDAGILSQPIPVLVFSDLSARCVSVMENHLMLNDSCLSQLGNVSS